MVNLYTQREISIKMPMKSPIAIEKIFCNKIAKTVEKAKSKKEVWINCFLILLPIKLIKSGCFT